MATRIPALIQLSDPRVAAQLVSNYNRPNDVAVWPCVWQPTPKTADVTVIKRLCSRPHSHELVIFFVFLAFIVFMLRPLC